MNYPIAYASEFMFSGPEAKGEKKEKTFTLLLVWGLLPQTLFIIQGLASFQDDLQWSFYFFQGNSTPTIEIKDTFLVLSQDDRTEF